jgi:hypothetical protein
VFAEAARLDAVSQDAARFSAAAVLASPQIKMQRATSSASLTPRRKELNEALLRADSISDVGRALDQFRTPLPEIPPMGVEDERTVERYGSASSTSFFVPA